MAPKLIKVIPRPPSSPFKTDDDEEKNKKPLLKKTLSSPTKTSKPIHRIPAPPAKKSIVVAKKGSTTASSTSSSRPTSTSSSANAANRKRPPSATAAATPSSSRSSSSTPTSLSRRKSSSSVKVIAHEGDTTTSKKMLQQKETTEQQHHAPPTTNNKRKSITLIRRPSSSMMKSDRKNDSSNNMNSSLLGNRRKSTTTTTTAYYSSQRRNTKTGFSSSSLSSRSTTMMMHQSFKSKFEIKRMLDNAAITVQRWWRLISSKLKYNEQIRRLRRTQAARAIQIAWMRYTFRFYSSHRIHQDFQRWIFVRKSKLLNNMRLLLRRALIVRRHAAIVICRSIRWRVLRPLRAKQIKHYRAAKKIQEWYRDTSKRALLRKLRYGVEDMIIDLYKAENTERQIQCSEEHLEFVRDCVILCKECEMLTRAGDHLESYRLFLRGGGYDPRISRGQERLSASEQVARHDIEQEMRVNWENEIVLEHRLRRQEILKFEKEQIIDERKRIERLKKSGCGREGFGAAAGAVDEEEGISSAKNNNPYFFSESRPPSAGFVRYADDESVNACSRFDPSEKSPTKVTNLMRSSNSNKFMYTTIASML